MALATSATVGSEEGGELAGSWGPGPGGGGEKVQRKVG